MARLTTAMAEFSPWRSKAMKPTIEVMTMATTSTARSRAVTTPAVGRFVFCPPAESARDGRVVREVGFELFIVSLRESVDVARRSRVRGEPCCARLGRQATVAVIRNRQCSLLRVWVRLSAPQSPPKLLLYTPLRRRTLRGNGRYRRTGRVQG